MRVTLCLGLLVAACADPAPCGPPAIRLAPAVIEVGRLEPGAVRRFAVAWRRVGRGALRVLAVEADCGCVVAAGPRGLQPDGARGALAVDVRAGRRHGPFRHRVTLYTDQPPPRDRACVHLEGWTGAGLVLAPATVELGPRSPRVRLRRDAEVRMRRPAPGLGARLVGLRGRVRMLPPVRGDVPGRLLRIDVTTPASAGPFEGHVLLEQDGRLLGRLPVRGVVEGAP